LKTEGNREMRTGGRKKVIQVGQGSLINFVGRVEEEGGGNIFDLVVRCHFRFGWMDRWSFHVSKCRLGCIG